MEDRLAAQHTERPGIALTALAVILLTTAAWWALALWPVGAEPDWLTRTRAACFGSGNGTLPHAGGWILLIGEPIGMLVALRLLWGRSLKRDLDLLLSRPFGRASLALTAVAGITFTLMLSLRVARALPREAVEMHGTVTPLSVGVAAPGISLVDQHGRDVRLSDFRGSRVVLTFLFAHCETVCPSTIGGLRALRSRHGKSFPIVVVTLDPWRDTPERLPHIAKQWQLGGADRVLSGSVASVERLLEQLGIARTRDDRTGEVVHASTVMLIDEQGRVAWRADTGGGASWDELPVAAGWPEGRQSF